jgi:hypothetical protein
VVLVIRGSRPAQRLRGSSVFRSAAHDANAILYVRRS